MAGKALHFFTNFTQGEISEEVEARVDVAKRNNGARVIENFWPMIEGGCYRRPGTRFICEVKDSSKFTRALPFEYSTTDAFAIEAAHNAFRFLKNYTQLQVSGSPYEIVSPYDESDLRDLHHEQSADFLFITSLNPALDVQKLARVTDTNWTVSDFAAQPPPSFDADENLAIVGAPNASTGAITWRVGADTFLAGDVGRQIVASSGRAAITAQTARELTATVLDSIPVTFTNGTNTLTSVGTTVTSTSHGRSASQFVVLTSGAQSGEIRQIASITDANTFEIDAAFSADQGVGVTWKWTTGYASGAWLLRLAPQTTLDVNKKEPVGASVTIATGAAALRSAYEGRYIKLLGGTIKITKVLSTTSGEGQIMSVLTDATTADPAAVAAGAWRLQETSWSTTRGRPRTIALHQGRLVLAGTETQPNTFWGSNLNDIYNFATGALATDAYEYTFTGGKQNPVQWIRSLGALFLGDARQEYSAKGQGIDTPIGGDETPYVRKLGEQGSQHVQAIAVDGAILLLHRIKHDVVMMSYSLQDSPDGDSFVPSDITVLVRHIGDMMFAKHPPMYWQKPDSIVFYFLENGQLAGLTFRPREEIRAWSRTVTDGVIESGCIVPHENNDSFLIYLIVRRTINGQTKRYWEYFEPYATELTSRGWTSLNTDCAKVGTLLAGATTITGLSHLEAKTVDVIIGSSYIGQKTVSSSQITLTDNEIPESDTTYEVGLHYNSTLTTLRPVPREQVVEGYKRYWPIVFARLKNTIGGKLNGQPLKPNSTARLFSGLARLENVRTADDYDGALTFTQDQPYPMTVVNVSGKISFADDMG